MTRMDTASLGTQVAAYRERIESVLDRILALPDPGSPRLREAMRYSVLGGGTGSRPGPRLTSQLRVKDGTIRPPITAIIMTIAPSPIFRP